MGSVDEGPMDAPTDPEYQSVDREKARSPTRVYYLKYRSLCCHLCRRTRDIDRYAALTDALSHQSSLIKCHKSLADGARPPLRNVNSYIYRTGPITGKKARREGREGEKQRSYPLFITKFIYSNSIDLRAESNSISSSSSTRELHKCEDIVELRANFDCSESCKAKNLRTALKTENGEQSSQNSLCKTSGVLQPLRPHEVELELCWAASYSQHCGIVHRTKQPT
uniref:Uncharacterized protein n=1 Tax=Trichogramma kaykai TaxID=54128 RepID=A0ABD2WGV8_9HYME